MIPISSVFAFRIAYLTVAALICGGGVTGCAEVSGADTAETMQTRTSIAQPPNDGHCPILTGDYRETGEGRFNNGKTFVAHLMGNAFADGFYQTRNPSDHAALFVSAFQQTPGTLRLNAILNGEVVGEREFGNSTGWYCSQQRLVKFNAKRFNIEAGSGTQVELHTFFVSDDHDLCATQDWKMDYVFGGSRDSGYSFTACYRRKAKQ